jgi:hypothetical protein
VGNSLLLIGRLGYRLPVNRQGTLEIGLTLRSPLGKPFREFAGTPVPLWMQTNTRSDFGGHLLVRLVSFYLRGEF